MDQRGRYERGTSRVERAQRERRAIFDALLRLIREEPAPKISVLELARAAHVGPNTIYKHFAGVDGAWEHVFHRGYIEWLSWIDEASSVERMPRARLDALARAALDYARERPLWVSLLLRRAEPDGELFRGLRERLEAAWAEACAHGAGREPEHPEQYDAAVGALLALAGKISSGDCSASHAVVQAALLRDLWLRLLR